MSYAAAQRVIVRMLYDAAFRQAVYDAPYAVLAGVDLTAAERDALVKPDPRAFGTDPFRRSRSLQALLEEYPVSGWLAGRVLGDVRQLDRFFSSPFFHDCIQNRGSLAHAFGEFLDRGSRAGEIRDNRIAWTAAVEGAIAALRRRGLGAVALAPAVPDESAAIASMPPATPLALSPRHAILTVAGGTGELVQQVRAHLGGGGRDVVATLLAGGSADFTGPLNELQVDEEETLLLERAHDPGGDVTLEHAHSGLAALLAQATRGTTAQALWAEATHHGATPEEARDIVAGLVADGLLVPAAGADEESA